jgi:PPK2 family polyphosphate:nucleotide phosphotransferase
MNETEFERISVEPYLVVPGSRPDPTLLETASTGSFGGGKTEGREALKRIVKRLDRLQRLLWADDRQKLLVVLQAIDTGGKDGTIRRVFGKLNPQGVRVVGFKAPTREELAHDYLWRVHRHTPASGGITVFNRSHYEDVLVVRVLELVGAERWSRRYGHINDFERLLTDEGTTILKFFLNISPDEQRRRLQARLDDPDKRWKFSAADLDHRARWDDYMEAFGAMLEETSTEYAPWHVVPADNKWYRDLVVAQVVANALEGLDLSFPEPEAGLDDLTVE